MNRKHHALVLGTAKDGTLDGIVDLTAYASAARFKELVSRTRIDLEKHGLSVEIQTEKPSRSKTRVRRNARKDHAVAQASGF